MDNPLNLITIALFVYFAYLLWYNYFAKVNKMTDEQMISRYIYLKRKGVIK